MSKHEKLIERFLSKPKDFTWQKLKTLLKLIDYVEVKTGRSNGSRAKFVSVHYPPMILLKLHPAKILK